ncbi:MAG: selenocysteine lyase/cysteine desulfurase [Candidatus Paceibacteria bacterium]|jgi:selenocysteine lyase/cysteine desulfurase
MQDLKHEFPAIQNQTYLNTASSGLLSRSLFNWRKQHEIDLINEGADFNIRKQILEDTRASVARFFDACIDEVALVPNFSLGFNTILEGLPRGQKVLLLENDYPSLLWPIETRDFEVCYVSITETLEDAILQAFKTHCPDIFVFSIVQWLTGIKIDLSFLKELKFKYPQVLFMADGTQYLGTEYFSFKDNPIDVLGASCYKWLLAGFGNGVMMIKQQAQERIFPATIGFNSAATFDSKAIDTAFVKYFEPGHQDSFNFGSLHQAILQAERYGIDAISNKIKSLSSYAKECFVEFDLLDDATKNRKVHSSIFNFKGDMKLFKDLQSQTIICSPRGGGLRASFHFYNSKEDIDLLFETMKLYL